MAPAGYAYLIRAESGLHKIGASVNPWARADQLPDAQGRLTLVHVIPSDDHAGLEGRLHAAFAHKRVGGEWFNLDADDVARICSLTGAGVLPDWVPERPAPPPGRVPVEFRAGPVPVTPTKSFKLPPSSLENIQRIRSYHGLPTDTAAIMFAVATAYRALPPDAQQDPA